MTISQTLNAVMKMLSQLEKAKIASGLYTQPGYRFRGHALSPPPVYPDRAYDPDRHATYMAGAPYDIGYAMTPIADDDALSILEGYEDVFDAIVVGEIMTRRAGGDIANLEDAIITPHKAPEIDPSLPTDEKIKILITHAKEWIETLKREGTEGEDLDAAGLYLKHLEALQDENSPIHKLMHTLPLGITDLEAELEEINFEEERLQLLSLFTDDNGLVFHEDGSVEAWIPTKHGELNMVPPKEDEKRRFFLEDGSEVRMGVYGMFTFIEAQKRKHVEKLLEMKEKGKASQEEREEFNQAFQDQLLQFNEELEALEKQHSHVRGEAFNLERQRRAAQVMLFLDKAGLDPSDYLKGAKKEEGLEDDFLKKGGVQYKNARENLEKARERYRNLSLLADVYRMLDNHLAVDEKKDHVKYYGVIVSPTGAFIKPLLNEKQLPPEVTDAYLREHFVYTLANGNRVMRFICIPVLNSR